MAITVVGEGQESGGAGEPGGADSFAALPRTVEGEAAEEHAEEDNPEDAVAGASERVVNHGEVAVLLANERVRRAVVLS